MHPWVRKKVGEAGWGAFSSWARPITWWKPTGQVVEPELPPGGDEGWRGRAWGGGGGGTDQWGWPKPPKKPKWWGEPWFGEGTEVEIPGLGVVNLRSMQFYNQMDPLWRTWLQKVVAAAGEMGWWEREMISPLRWMVPRWEEM